MSNSWLNAFIGDQRTFIAGGGHDEDTLKESIARIQGFRRRENPGRLELPSTLSVFDWFRILEIRRSEESQRDADLSTTLTALSRLERVGSYLIGGCDGEAIVCIGISKGSSRLLRTAITSSVDVSWQEGLPAWLAQLAEPLASLVYSGIPAPCGRDVAHRPKSAAISCADRILTALQGSTGRWMFILLFHPVSTVEVLNWQFSVAEEIRRVRLDYRQPGTKASYSRMAERYEELLSTYLKLLDQSLAEGGWLTYGTVYATPQLIQQVHAVLAAAFAGVRSRPEPWRLRPAGAQVITLENANWSGQLTFLPSSHLARMVSLPSTEHLGIAVTQTTRFDLVPSVNDQSLRSLAEPAIALGKVVDGAHITGQSVYLEPAALVRHVFVTGITGSGKSTTVRTLISQLALQGVRLLIIEPVKREYRYLDVSGLRVFSLGDPGCALKMSPFVFEGVSCSTHVDHLMSLFSAAYVLYPPMPYILEQALYEVYRDKGWDFTSGVNWRALKSHPRSFPTLTELYIKTSEVIARSGYGPRLEPEIRAALEVRLNTMRIGAKGALLDTPYSVTLDELTAQPTVLELQGIGDPEQRAFLMGLILTKIYEGCIAAGPSEKLRLVVVLEEAHRLLEEKSRSGEDFANPQAKAIEAFGDMLAELRAYGVGLIVAEQSPSRVTRLVLKNTATKLVHQLVDAADRELIAGATVLSDDESQHLATLPPGQALLFTHGMNRPIRISVASRGYAPQHDQRVFSGAQDASSARLSAIKASLQDDPHLLRAVLRMLSAWLLSDHVDDDAPIRNVSETIRERSPIIIDSEFFLQQLTIELIKYKLETIISAWGRLYGWSFEQEDAVLASLSAHAECLLMRPAQEPSSDLSGAVNLRQKSKPFAGCRDCSAPCLYRPFIHFVEMGKMTSVSSRMRENDVWEEIGLVVQEQVNTVVSGTEDVLAGAQRCFLAHAAASSDLSRKQQVEFVSRVMLSLQSDL